MVKIVKKSFILLALLLVMLGLLELGLRLLGIYPQYGYPKGLFQNDELLTYSLTPNFKGIFKRHEFTTEITTNSLGLPDDEIPQKEASEFRILFLGDSFTFGRYGVTIAQTFPKILEKKLNAPHFRVINTGVPGYDTYQESLYLKNQGIKLTPDMVILNFFVGNDFLENIQNHNVSVREGFLYLDSIEANIITNVRFFLLSHLYSYQIFEKSLINSSKSLKDVIKGKISLEEYQSKLYLTNNPSDMREQFARTIEILEDLRSFLVEKEIHLVLVIIPTNYQVDNALKTDFIKSHFHDNFYDLELPQKKLKEWGEKSAVSVIDLMPQMQKLDKNNDFYWPLNGHFNARGNEVVGNIIYEGLTSFFNFPEPEKRR